LRQAETAQQSGFRASRALHRDIPKPVCIGANNSLDMIAQKSQHWINLSADSSA
jgi:hypothetical protein